MKTLADILAAGSAHLSRVTPEMPVSHALKLMAGLKTNTVLVYKEQDALPCGIFLEQDLVRCHTLFPGEPLDRVSLRDVMTPDPVTAEIETSVKKALNRMLTLGINCLPVTADGRVIGLLGLADLVKAHKADLTEEISHLQNYIKDLQDAAHD